VGTLRRAVWAKGERAGKCRSTGQEEAERVFLIVGFVGPVRRNRRKWESEGARIVGDFDSFSAPPRVMAPLLRNFEGGGRKKTHWGEENPAGGGGGPPLSCLVCGSRRAAPAPADFAAKKKKTILEEEDNAGSDAGVAPTCRAGGLCSSGRITSDFNPGRSERDEWSGRRRGETSREGVQIGGLVDPRGAARQQELELFASGKRRVEAYLSEKHFG